MNDQGDSEDSEMLNEKCEPLSEWVSVLPLSNEH